MKRIFLFFLFLLPTALLSRLFGIFSRISFPAPIQKAVIGIYVWLYGVKLDESQKTLGEYSSLNEFFTRALKPRTRPIDKKADSIISPVDGLLSHAGRIDGNTFSLIFEAKKNKYNLEELLQGSACAERFINGLYALFYLSPKDCHRIYSPCDAQVTGYVYIPGRLLPVQEWVARSLSSLFVQNERLVTLLSYKNKMIALAKVGAVNVGSISVSYDSAVQTNSWQRMRSFHTYQKPPRLKKGEELGRFQMGSTVILLFEKNTIAFSSDICAPQAVRYGQKIGKLKA